MEGKYTEKLEQKQATSMQVIDAQKSLDGRDRQINERLPLDGSQPMEGRITMPLAPAVGTDVPNKAYVDSQDGAVINFAQSAANAAQANATAVANNAQIAANQAQVSANQGIAQAGVAQNQAANALNVGQNAQQAANQADNHAQQAMNAANAADKAAQQAQQTANSADKAAAAASKAASAAAQVAKTSALAGANRHVHSQTPYVMYEKEARQAMLSIREEIRSLAKRSESEEVRILAGAVEVLFRLQMDYRDMDAFERERRLEDPEWSEWSESYREAFNMDEYAQESRESFQPLRNGRMDPYEGIVLNGNLH